MLTLWTDIELNDDQYELFNKPISVHLTNKFFRFFSSLHSKLLQWEKNAPVFLTGSFALVIDTFAFLQVVLITFPWQD